MANPLNSSHALTFLFFLVFISSLLMASCEEAKKPEFKGIEHAKLSDIQDGILIISADLKYFNPNNSGGSVEAVDIEVIANNVSLGKAVQAGKVNIKGNEDFKIPLIVSVSAKELIKNQSGLISGILDAFVNKKINVTFKGTTTLKVLGINFNHAINYEERLEL